jgi:kynurenine formamidase
VVIDISEATSRDHAYRLTADDVRGFEKAHGRIAAGTIAIVRTGWSRFWPNRKAYLGDDTPGDASHLVFPRDRRRRDAAAGRGAKRRRG